MIKKLILLLLVVCGGVSAQAEQVTRRIIVEDQYWFNSTGVYILAYYNNGTNDVDLAGWGTPMNFLGSYEYDSKYRRIYYYDLTADESVFNNDIKIQFYSSTSAADNKTERAYFGDKYSEDRVFYLWPNKIDNNTEIGCSWVPLTYFLIGVETSNNVTTFSKLADLTYSNCIATGTYENTKTTYAVVAPNYALWDNFAGFRNWAFVYRAADGQNDYDIADFIKYTPSINATDKTFKFSFVGSLDMSFDIKNKTSTITPYFTRTINAAESNGSYYATFSSDYNVAIPDGLTAYYAGNQQVNGSVSMTSFTSGIPANEGVFLKASAASAEYTFTPAETTDAVSGNMLKPTSSYSYDSSKSRYVFAKQGNDVGFYKIGSDNYSPAPGKAYLELPGSSAPSLSIELDGEATGIKVINLDTNTATSNERVYDLAGRRVENMTKGLYIVNGKKVIVK